MAGRRRSAPVTSACIRRGESPAGGWPVLAEQTSLLPQRVVLTCTACTEVTEIAADDPQMPEHCRCGGWTWTGDLVEPAVAGQAS